MYLITFLVKMKKEMSSANTLLEKKSIRQVQGMEQVSFKWKVNGQEGVGTSRSRLNILNKVRNRMHKQCNYATQRHLDRSSSTAVPEEQTGLQKCESLEKQFFYLGRLPP